MSRTYLVTGANRGIGLELARQLSARGDRVIATARHPEAATELTQLPVQVEALEVTDPASVAALAQRLAGTAIDVLINNAGISPDPGGIAQIDVESFSRLFSVNSLGPLRVTQALLPHLRAGERRVVVSLSSELASITANASGGYYGYRASKAALNMLNKSLALELAGKGFICIVINPGWVQTDMGGPAAPLPVADSVAGILKVVDGLGARDIGAFFAWDGSRVPW